MNHWDIVAIVIGLVVGWVAVSTFMNWLIAKRRASALDFERHVSSGADLPWPRILGVEPDATPEQIEAAYERRLEELGEAAPGILTEPERQAQQRKREILDAARAAALGE